MTAENPQPPGRRTRFDRWLDDAYATRPEGLAIYRIVFAVYYLVVVSRPLDGGAAWLSRLPDAVFLAPPGPLSLFGGFPDGATMLGMRVVAWAAGFALLLGWRTRMVSLVLGATMILHDGFFFSVGKIDHGGILLFTIPLIMAFSGWGRRWSLDAARGRAELREKLGGPALAILALFVGFTMISAGIPKIVGGWLDTSTQAVYSHLYRSFYVLERQELLAPFFLELRSPLAWELQDWVTVIFEVGFLAAIARRGVFRIFCAAAVCFHLGVLLVLNISFVSQLLAYAAFIDWHKLADTRLVRALRRLADAIRARGRAAQIAALASLGAALVVTNAVVRRGLDEVVIGGVGLTTWLIFAAAAAVALYFLARRVAASAR